MFYYLLLSIPLLRVSGEHIVGPPNLKLLECFEYKKNYWIVGHAFHTSSVQFKDECLRMCLTSAIRKAKCLSAMHIPNDDECVISDQNQLTKPDLFVENDSPASFTVNYFRNICIDPPENDGARRLEVRLHGSQGQGLLEFSQQAGKRMMVMVVISGLRENSAYDVELIDGLTRITSCQKIKNPHGKKILTVDTDNTGMAVQPWIHIDNLSLFDEDINDKLVAVIDRSTKLVVDCGRIDQNPENLVSSASSSFSYIVTGFLAFFYFMF
ncbi:unnamed protein product [Caenorhabditis bovis]|uniref:Apple domain-containing protein n=1 Tax=Caenorhabditis bovis TaxID=2654633 RepID=A0A8S1EM86_9PELO|nr:unnamed protein product [Caenorhabditis bovis]